MSELIHVSQRRHLN